MILPRARAERAVADAVFRGANGVGYTNYPRQRREIFRQRKAANAGMDIFRVFDCLNWIENMRVAIDAILETGKLAEGVRSVTPAISSIRRARNIR